MAKKKTSQQNASSPQEFSSSPFKNLKGLSAYAEPKVQSQGLAVSRASFDDKGPTASSKDIDSFAVEMTCLGVRPLPGRDVQELAPEGNPEQQNLRSPETSREDRENAVFLEAIGSVEKVFKDEWPGEETVKQAVPRRIKQVERGQLVPEAELDLHGLTVIEASEKVLSFLRDVSSRGFQTVLIITGKGLHSNDGPVLRNAMGMLLNQQRERVVEWGVAPRRFGGEGALVVFLRQVVVG